MTNHREPVSRGQGNEFLNKLEEAGLYGQLAQKVIDSKGNNLAIKVVKFITNGGFEATTIQKRAREIMGRNIFGVEEAIQHFGINPLRQQIAVLSEIPFSEATLEQCKDTHILIAVFPLSILEIRGKVFGGQRLFYDQDWYNNQVFAKDRGETEWQLVRKEPRGNSTSKTWNEQQGLLLDNEETTKARVMVYTTIGHFLATGERLFEKIYVRCIDLDSGGGRVFVGIFDSGGLDVGSYWGGIRDDIIGLASARKFE